MKHATWETASTILAKLEGSGGRSAWNFLDSSFRGPIERYGRKRGLDEAEAEDLVQDTLAILSEALRAGRYDPTRGRLRDYMFGIVQFRLQRELQASWRTHLRAGSQVGPDTEGILDRLADERLDPDEPWEAEWSQFVLEQALSRVRSEVEISTYEIFHAYALDGLDPDEVARRFGVQRTTVYNVKNRVMSRVRERMREFDDI